MTKELVALAARNNAEWCDAVCRANGRGGEFHDALWLNRHGTPRFYPDAVTLACGEANQDVLARVSAALAEGPERAWAVKDSFSDLDLAGLGFSPLFDACWIYRDFLAGRHDRNNPTVRIVRGEAELAAWSEAWSCGDAVADSVPFKPFLLRNPAVLFAYVERAGIAVGGGVLSSSAGAVGLSNVFSGTGCADLVWQALIAFAERNCPSLPLVGYERGSDLDAACRNGFRPIGALRVWLRSA